MDKYGVLSFNLNENTSQNMKMQFIILCFLFAFQVTISLSIPFLFYHPQQLLCTKSHEGSEFFPCTEQEMCKNHYFFRYLDSEIIHSISMEYDFFCISGQLQESAMLGLALIGQVVGFAISMFFDIPKPHKAKMLLFTVIIESALLISIKIIYLPSFFLSVALSCWNGLFAFYFGQQYAYICDVYSATINNVAPVALGFMQPFIGLFYILYASYDKEWRNHLAYFTAIPLLAIGVIWFCIYDYRNDENETVKEEKSKIAKIDQYNFIQDLLFKYNELITQPKMLTNSIMYVLCWLNSSMAYTSSYLVFSDIKVGSFFYNMYFSQVADVFGGLLAYILFRCFPSRNVMFISSIIAGFVQCATFGLNHNSSYYAEMGPIVVARAYKSIIVGGLLIVTPQLVPFRYLLLLFTFSNIATLGLSSVMPLYKIICDQFGINIFVTFGVMAFICSYYIRKWTYKEDLGIQETNLEQDAGVQKNQMTQFMQTGAQPIRGKKMEKKQSASEIRDSEALLEYHKR
ncbi:hypothetical protein IMG5_189820 [Ichthyophthirius multifiliis]|uniref:Major facilitator superfamily protein n=1 Tax=Ichthyophthirius multifiliis TaxID=5932 RepID=G0R452_ICHMU|nr:hypothetical protein IMG5_189820 [Ichthyophthirius multifiliis]EGR27752.1 hypothetical protein IMG5_189820 [Ichthyophthirius multifiliis]|eukprot:XP_004025204.1 hypothetical protein IMG5_189820 [Ichthyophthirius multifiliis]